MTLQQDDCVVGGEECGVYVVKDFFPPIQCRCVGPAGLF